MSRSFLSVVSVASVLLSSASACTCSPFSGNEGSCCTVGDTCSHWGSSPLTCTGANSVCCNSDFSSNCCPSGSGCTQGCRNSFLGPCDCLPLRPSSYDESSALYSLRFVAASQCEPEKGLNETWSCDACPASTPLREVTVVQEKGHQCLVGFDGEKFVVAFRGSLSFEDWMADLKSATMEEFTLRPDCVGCEVGSGWFSAYSSLRSGVYSALYSLASAHPSSGLIITGHSLGAAMASLFLADLEVSDPPLFKGVQLPVYTFGEPRVGNEHYASWFEDRFPSSWYRVVHHDDPVPHLPPPLLGFRHGPTEVWYAESGTGFGFYEVCDGEDGEDQQCSAGTTLSAEITDHLTYMDHGICGCEDSGFR